MTFFPSGSHGLIYTQSVQALGLWLAPTNNDWIKSMSKPDDSVEQLNPTSQDAYRQEQVQLLYKGLPLSLISSLIIALLLSVSHLPVIGQAEIIVWNLLLGATLIARLALWQFWLNAMQVYPASLWLQLFRLGACLTGIAWGSAAILIYANDSIYQALLSFSLAGVVSGSLTSLSADRLSALGFALFAVCPLTIRFVVGDSPTAFAMSAMTVLFMIFVVSSSGRTAQELRRQIQHNNELLALSRELQNNRDVDLIVTLAQSQFIADKNHVQAMQLIIDKTRETTASELGFIGEVHQDAEHKPFMKILVYSAPPKGDKVEFFHQQHEKQTIEFHNLNGLFGKIMQTGKPVFCENPRQDIRSTGMPDKHPDIYNFIGIPLFRGEQLLAIMCLANSPQNYHQTTIELLNPINMLISQFMHTLQLQRQHKQDIAVLEETSIQTQTILDDIADGIITLDKYGLIRSFNKAAETIFGYKAEQILGQKADLLMPTHFRHGHSQKISDYLRTGKSSIIGIGREVTGLRRNGKEFPMDLMVSPITREGEPMFIGIVRDISEKHLMKELNRKLLQNLSRELASPVHAISLSLTILEHNVSIEKHSNSKNLIKLAHQHTYKLQQSIEKILQKTPNEKPDIQQAGVFKAIDIIEKIVKDYQHIAEVKGARFSLTSRLYDEHILVNQDIFENLIVYFLELAAEYNAPFSEIKILAEQVKGGIRIYFIDKSNQSMSDLQKNEKWKNNQAILGKINALCGTENFVKENSKTTSSLVFMEFPLAMNKAGY